MANTDKAFSGNQWEDAQPAYKPPENANLMAGGTEHTAGGKTVDVGLVDAAKSISRDDWTKLHRKPCVKDSLLTGIGAGFAVGGARAIWRGMQDRAMSDYPSNHADIRLSPRHGSLQLGCR